MTDKFPIDEAQIVGLFMECILFGVYLVTLGICLRVLLWTRHGWKTTINRPMLIVALLMAVFATADVAFGLRHNLDAFVWFTGPGGAQAEFADISYWVNIMKTVDYAAQTCIGDGMLIYRCYIVYGRRWRTAVPSALLAVGGAVCCVMIIFITATLDTDAFLNAPRLVPFISSALALTFALNILNTTMIVYRIWRINKQTAGFVANSGSYSSSGIRLEVVIRIIVESGLLYTLSVAVFAATYFASNNAQYGASDNIVQIIGIVFNLVIIRVDQGTVTDATTLMQVSSLRAGARDSIPLQLVNTQATAPGSIPKLSGGVNVDMDISHAVDYRGKS